ncbi:MAG TPA: DUF4388 domain-containing protein [Candidatus Polarisedimenticolia bacterium]
MRGEFTRFTTLAGMEPDPEVRQALVDLQRYLSDQLAPLMVVDAIQVLISCPPRLAAAAIESWAATQHRGGAEGVTATDYLFHAIRKIHMMAQLNLIKKDSVSGYVEALGQIVVEMCPPEDRESFRATLKGLGAAEAELLPSVQALHMRAGAAAGGGRAADARGGAAGRSEALSAEAARGMKRFALLVERLEREAKGGAAAGAAGAELRGQLVTQILTTAALNSSSGTDLDQYMQRLSQMGVDARTDQVFRALGRSLPGWIPPAGVAGAAGAQPAGGRSAEAMRRLVSMAGSPLEGKKRFSEMVQAAIEQFNEGQLAKAAAMFEVAERLVADRKVDPESARLVRERAHQSLESRYLREFSEKSETHVPLRKVLNFFPALGVTGLLTDLDGEEKRDRRKLYLSLLEAHGPAARAAALERIAERVASGEPDRNGFFTRNLVFLLRRIPPPGSEASEKEIGLLGHLVKWGAPLIVIKEAIGTLGQIRHTKAEQALMARMHEFEATLVGGGLAAADAEEMKILLDRVASTLARMGTPDSWRNVVNHALSRDPALGDTMARLLDLGGQDLSADGELTEHLIATLRAELPKKVLGFVVQKKNDHVLHLVQALSGTQTAATRQVLEEIVERYPGQEFARAAQKALSGSGAQARPAEGTAMTFSGDLDLFGLPSLLQNVADGRMFGLLSLTDRENRTIAQLDFEAGKISECRAGALTGETALYQLFERPVPGCFLFRSRRAAPAESPEKAGTRPPLIDPLPAVFEAMRRHDEFQQARVLVPDDASMKPTGVKPTGPPDGEESEFLHAVWEQASSGATPTVCESAVATDSYRIRRLYAHWVEQGALQPR